MTTCEVHCVAAPGACLLIFRCCLTARSRISVNIITASVACLSRQMNYSDDVGTSTWRRGVADLMPQSRRSNEWPARANQASWHTYNTTGTSLSGSVVPAIQGTEL